ncbi:MAG: gliding motility-associated C-terminal domain-containing protein [Bacteroidota bacterium]
MLYFAHKINVLIVTSLGIFLLATFQARQDSMPLWSSLAARTVPPNSCKCNRTADSLELVDFYARTGGPSWRNKWELDKPIDQWYGVVLDEKKCVKCLDLDGDPNCTTKKSKGNQLKGILPDLQLPGLTFLSLGSNKLEGIIPNFYCLPKLKVLHLSSNNLHGNIPDFRNLQRLVSIELDYNNLEGPIPDFQYLPQLQNLYVNSNQISGSIPDFHHLPKLKNFIAHNNQLEGRLPSFERTPALRLLRLSKNQLKGEIPSFEAFPQLVFVDLAHNQLQGAIPNFSANEKLTALLLNNNELENSRAFDQEVTSAYAYFSVAQNRLSLKDLQNLAVEKRMLAEYNHQRMAGKDTIVILETGQDLLLTPPENQEVDGNRYSWYKDDSLYQQAGDEGMLLLEEAGDDVAGSYYCEIVNERFPGLKLLTPATHIQLKLEEAEKFIAPVAHRDAFRFVQSEEAYLLNILGNDEVSMQGQWEVELLSEPQVGYLVQSHSGNLRFVTPPGFEGSTQFEYQICHLQDTLPCSRTTVEVEILPGLDRPSYAIPGFISPNGDGKEDVFRIREFDEHPEYLEQSEFLVYDSRGTLVFRQAPFQNNWRGTYMNTEQTLSNGAYFYVIKTRLSSFGARGTLSIVR